MFIHYVAALASVGFFVVLAEVIANFKPNLPREITRKIAHVGIAIAISIWPFYLDWLTIQILGVIITLAVIITIRFDLTSAIHGVARKNYGEVLFGIAIITAGMTAQSPAIFCVAILFLGLADGLAAVTGTLWGKTNSYRVFGDLKSLVGSATFLIAALMIVTGYSLATGHALPAYALIGIPLIATVLENVSIRGTDNITVPLVAIVCLNILA